MNIAIIGATGLVGREILKILHEKKLDNNNVFLYASKKSENLVIDVKNKQYKVKELKKENLEKKYDFALFSAGKNVSKEWASEFVSRGAYVIDNSSAFRRDKNIPLVVPEINGNNIFNYKIIANPNCSTIGASIPLYEIDNLYKIKRIIVSTYQAVSGAGQRGIDDLNNGKQGKFPFNIQNNLIPQIDIALENGYTFEEDKMDYELKKILNNGNLKIATTCVRVPILNCHSESINVEFFKKPNLEKIIKRLSVSKGVKLLNDLENNKYPMPSVSDGKDDIYVGRLRYDTSNENAINLFISFDNIRKGAALNAVQIMECIISKCNCIQSYI